MRLTDFGIHLSRELAGAVPSLAGLIADMAADPTRADEVLLASLERVDPKRAADKRRAIAQRKARAARRHASRPAFMTVTTLASVPTMAAVHDVVWSSRDTQR